MTSDEVEAYRAAAKEALRKRVAALRRTLSEPERAARAERAAAHVVTHPSFARSRVVLAYAPLRFELDPKWIVEAAWTAGKRVALPRVSDGSFGLTLHEHRPGDVLEESAMAIREPPPDAPKIAPEIVDLVLVPGLAFDGRGHRLGFGKGYYDRLLPTLTQAVRVGLAYELSLLAEVPAAAHDQSVHYVLTEGRLLEAGSA